jgi:hypothetical protein
MRILVAWGGPCGRPRIRASATDTSVDVVASLGDTRWLSPACTRALQVCPLRHESSYVTLRRRRAPRALKMLQPTKPRATVLSERVDKDPAALLHDTRGERRAMQSPHDVPTLPPLPPSRTRSGFNAHVWTRLSAGPPSTCRAAPQQAPSRKRCGLVLQARCCYTRGLALHASSSRPICRGGRTCGRCGLSVCVPAAQRLMSIASSCRKLGAAASTTAR